MNVLITGVAGFIGSNLADRLIEEGHTVSGIDNFTTGKRENINPNLKFFIEGDIANGNYIIQDETDVVVHAAASYKDPNDWITDAKTNVVGTINVITDAVRNNVKRIIYFQTSLCYGFPQENPITLNHPINPQNSYAITKTAGEQFIVNSGLDYISFRLANCYGERNFSGPVSNFYKRLTLGQQCTINDTRRDFVYIEDLLNIVIKAINGEGKSGIYHISTGKDYSIKELYDNVCSALNISDESVIFRERSADDVPTILLDPSKTANEFNFTPSVPLSYGITQAVNYYKKYGVTETYTHLKESK